MFIRCSVGLLALAPILFPSGAEAQFFGLPPPPPPVFAAPPPMYPSPVPGFQQGLGQRCATQYGVCLMNGGGPLNAPCFCQSIQGPMGGVIIP